MNVRGLEPELAFKVNVQHDIDVSLWTGIRGGMVALSSGASWIAALRLHDIVTEIMIPVVADHLGMSDNATHEYLRDRGVYGRWHSHAAEAAGDLFGADALSLWIAYQAVIADYRYFRDASDMGASTPSELEQWCLAEVDSERQPTPLEHEDALTRHKCSVVLPAYNKEDVIASTTQACVAMLQHICPHFEVIIVDDGSRDRTGAIIDDLAASDARIVAVHNMSNMGYGSALRAGFDVARGDWLFFMDADGQFDISDIAKLIAIGEQNEESAVVGYCIQRSDVFVRELNAWVWKQVSRAAIGLQGIRDIDCAFKLLPAQAVRDADLCATEISINTELLTKLQRMGVPIFQVPVKRLPCSQGNPTGADPHMFSIAFREIFRLRRHLQQWRPPLAHTKAQPHLGDVEKRHSRLELPLVVGTLLVAAILRVIWVLHVPNTPNSDFAGYQAHAVLLYNGLYPPDVTYQGLGYPLMLSLVYRLFGNTDILVGKLFNVVLSLATLVLCYFIFRKLSASKLVVNTAFVCVAILPTYIAYTGIIGTETFVTFLFACALLLQLTSFEWRLRYPLLGIFIGLATLTKPYFLVYPIVVAATYWLKDKDVRKTLQAFIVPAVFMLLTIAPVTYLNYREFHMFIVNTYNGGFNLWENSNDDNQVGVWIPLSSIHISPEFRLELQQHEVNFPNVPVDDRFAPLEPLFRREAEKWIIRHPVQYLELGVLRLNNTYFSGAWDIRAYGMDGVTDGQIQDSRGLRILVATAKDFLYLLSLAGVLFLAGGLRRIFTAVVRRTAVLSSAIVIPTVNLGFFAVVVFCTEGQPRYAYPSLFLLAYCTAFVLSAVVRSFQSMPASTDW